jgi:hypothetical protein
MAIASQHANQPATDTEKAVAKAQPWLEPAARLGYAAKGFVYALIGVLAALAAWNVHVGQRGDEMNQRGVLNFLTRQWYGTAVLIAIAVGLSGYALWRLISATMNAEDKGPAKRIGYAVSGITYAYIAYLSAKAVVGERANTDDKGAARNLMDKPFGQILLVAVGCVVLGIAAAQAWNAVTANFKDVFKLKEMKRWERLTAIWLGRIGLAARAILFGLIGGFFIAAGVKHDVQSAGGVSQALKTLQHVPAGNWILTIDCIGLVCYGLFMFYEARYRRIRMADPELVQDVKSGKA